MAEAEDKATIPAICQRVRATRVRLRDQWKAEHPGERGNPYTQAEVASRVGSEEGTEPPPAITLGAYGAFERWREPSLGRLRQIAVALGLDEDYFAPSGDLSSATAQLEAEVESFRLTHAELRELAAGLRSLLAEELPPQAPAEPE